MLSPRFFDFQEFNDRVEALRVWLNPDLIEKRAAPLRDTLLVEWPKEIAQTRINEKEHAVDIYDLADCSAGEFYLAFTDPEDGKRYMHKVDFAKVKNIYEP